MAVVILGQAEKVDVLSDEPASGAANAGQELASAFLTLGRLLQVQYPAQWETARAALDAGAAPATSTGSDPAHTAASVAADPWSKVFGDLADPFGQEIVAAIEAERRKANLSDSDELAEDMRKGIK